MSSSYMFQTSMYVSLDTPDGATGFAPGGDIVAIDLAFEADQIWD